MTLTFWNVAVLMGAWTRPLSTEQMVEKENGIDEFGELVMSGSAATSNASTQPSTFRRKGRSKNVQPQLSTTYWTESKERSKGEAEQYPASVTCPSQATYTLSQNWREQPEWKEQLIPRKPNSDGFC